jgi:Asp-tRNA(Asn)/Glu-tRNA(Gln) amidotransferase A subunit family amidase
MLGDRGWVGASADDIATAVRRGDTFATSVLVDHLDHVQVADRVLEAVRHRRDGAAAAEADVIDDLPDLGGLPLAGVPVMVGTNLAIAGMPTPDGDCAHRDHEAVRRLRGAGAVLLAAAAERAGRHPWLGVPETARGNAAVTGAAAAVVAGMVPLAVGTSVRVSSALAGVVGLDMGGDRGVFATNVNDAALGFAVLAGRPLRPIREPGRLRVAVAVPSGLFRPGPATGDTVAQAARLLVGLGHDVVATDGLPTIMWGHDLVVLPVAGPPSGLTWAANLVHRVRAGAYPRIGVNLPSVTVPMGTRSDGLPAAVLLVGPIGATVRLLEIAGQLERVAPWRRHAPSWPRPVPAAFRYVGVASVPVATPGTTPGTTPVTSVGPEDGAPARVVARSADDEEDTGNGAGDSRRGRGGPQGARRRRSRDADGAQPTNQRRPRRAGVAQV